MGPRTETDSPTEAQRSAGTRGYASPVHQLVHMRLTEAGNEQATAPVAAEVPVALVYNGRPHAVMMCTPADLEDFGVGFTVSEQIAAATEVQRVDVVRYARGIELQIEIPADAAERLQQRGRAIAGRTGCGLCGVETIDEALREPAPVQSTLRVSRAALWRAAEQLDTHQPMNAETHAIHAAAWATADGAVQIAREDVGRHNALDKVIGALARSDLDPATGFIIVTSRASYELVQKAAAVNVPLLAAVSRPTALAVELADTAGITLVGLLRGRSANVHTHPERIEKD
jgi:FdhD protein